jgi:hypothetical protein
VLTVASALDSPTSGLLDLRQAIDQANTDASNGQSDIIRFAFSLGRATITLTGDELELSGASTGATETIDGGSDSREVGGAYTLGKLGVTARPLRCQGEERLASHQVVVRVEALLVALDAALLERLPLAGDPHAAQVQHRLRPLRRPVHPGPLQPVLDQVRQAPSITPLAIG